ncbi:uncharacterized protein LOC111273573 isoform X2 [Varroa jacobsoni]|uniref:uncharacterized protein LOC111273573 isoform X2 n=1 Tax=Varroa jacobsoni TaxID=62625 RepID=UPI000BF712E5|nr:uncharacterized protein LOC111273573 isoform X2 [Varroa jacobsoni]
MWSFRNKTDLETISKRFVGLAASQGIFKGIELDVDFLSELFVKTLCNCTRSTYGDVQKTGKLCSLDRFLQIRTLAHADLFAIPMRSHLQLAIENFHEFPSLRNYDIGREGRDDPSEIKDRAHVRDAAVVLTHVLAECLVTTEPDQGTIISDLIGELLQSARQAKLWLTFSKFLRLAEDYVLEEITYGTLFYLVALQSTDDQWHLYNKWYAELPEELGYTVGLLETQGLTKGLLHPSQIGVITSMQKLAPLSLPIVVLLSNYATESETFCYIWQLEIHGRYNNDDNSDNKDIDNGQLELHGFKHTRHHDPSRQYGQNNIMSTKIRSRVEGNTCELQKPGKDDLCKRVGAYLMQNSFDQAVTVLGQLIDLMKTDDNDAALKEQLLLVCGYAALRSSDRDLMRRARQLLKSVKIHQGMVQLWTAELEIAACQYDLAKRSLGEASFEIVVMPGTDVVLHPVNQEAFEKACSSLLAQLENSPQADHVCCNRNTCAKPEIFERSLDFSGFVRVFCQEGCVLVLHPRCWKAMVGNLAGRRTKHGTGAQCCTPDCQGRINLLIMFNSRMEITKEYRWTSSSRRSLQDEDEIALKGQESNRRTVTRLLDKTIATTHSYELFEALRCTVASARHLTSVSELIDICADLYGADKDLASSFVRDILKDLNPATNPEWNRAQWLGAAKNFLENLDSTIWPNVNASLSSVVICETLSMDEALSINEEYAYLEKEFEDLLNEEVLLQNQIVQEHLQNDQETELIALEEEVQDLKQQYMRICSAESCIGSLTRSIMLKDGVLSGIKERLQEAEKKMNELLIKSRQESSKYQVMFHDKTQLASTVRANAIEARSRLSRALVELVQNRYHVGMDAIECIEQAVAANLREVERIRDPRVSRVNQKAKSEHFQLLKEMRERSKSIEKETRMLMKRLREGHLDPLEIASDSLYEPVANIIARYMVLPTLYRRGQNPSLCDVAKCLPK